MAPSSPPPPSFAPPDPGGLATLRRIKRNAWVFFGLAVLASLFFRSLPVTIGTVAGGLLAMINFRWMESGLDAALGAPMNRRKRAISVAKFVLRFVLLGLVIYVMIRIRIADLRALLAGLFIFVASILWEALKLTAGSLGGGGEGRCG